MVFTWGLSWSQCQWWPEMGSLGRLSKAAGSLQVWHPAGVAGSAGTGGHPSTRPRYAGSPSTVLTGTHTSCVEVATSRCAAQRPWRRLKASCDVALEVQVLLPSHSSGQKASHAQWEGLVQPGAMLTGDQAVWEPHN